MVVSGTYNPYIVALSVLVASFASYTALDLGGRVAAAHGPARRIWLAAAAIAMGGGIWSMHFVGMLAFIMPMMMSYDFALTSLSLVLAIVVTSGGFYVTSRFPASPLRLALGGVFMGLGIVGMHYTGMAAMRGDVAISYDRLLVALSVIIAIGAAAAALWLAFRTTNRGQKILAAIVMGIAISGMHYTGMEAAIFTTHGRMYGAPESAGLDQTHLAVTIAAITFAVLTCALIASMVEQRRAEEALRQARADLAHINRVTTMGELAGALAHEVNQPIAAAVANASACLRWLGGSSPNLEEARKAAMGVVDNGKRAAEVIERIRRLFKKETAQRELLDANEMIREIVMLMNGEMARSFISLRTELAGDIPRIMGDRVQLQQVLMNLILNGMEAMRELDGPRELAITSRRAEHDQLDICVSDTGVGLSPQHRDRIFDAFFTTKRNGTGLGLSISRSIIEAHHGRLWASDNVPRGTRFHFTLRSPEGALAVEGEASTHAWRPLADEAVSQK
jgi:NO-binding membrane sensor protein with MHYT domain